MSLTQTQDFDLCIIVEGVYPYGVGGVSTWVHQYLARTSHLRVALVSVISVEERQKIKKFTVPAHVTHFEIEIFNTTRRPLKKLPAPPSDANFFISQAALNMFIVQPTVGEGTFWDWMLSQVIDDQSPPFLPRLWTYRIMWSVLLDLSLAEVPRAKVYQTTSTGFAGFLGACFKKRNSGSRLIITEHGLYTRERWLEGYSLFARGIGRVKPLLNAQNIWLDHFSAINNLAYHQADCLTSVSHFNSKIQQEIVGDRIKARVIWNSYTVSGDTSKRLVFEKPPHFHVAYAGRISFIKNPQAFVRLAAAILNQDREFSFSFFGAPDLKDRAFDQSWNLVEAFGIKEFVSFYGHVSLSGVLDKIDVLVLTSYSEGLPFIILDALNAGVPVVTFDVGGCREIIEALGPLRPAGILVEFGDYLGLAQAIMRIKGNSNLREMFVRNGQEALVKHFSHDSFNEYLEIVDGLL